MEVPLYTATVRLQIDRNVAKIVNTEGVIPVEDSDYDFMRTQYELLKSRNMAERVVSALSLGDDPDLLKPREMSLLGSRDGTVQLLLEWSRFRRQCRQRRRRRRRHGQRGRPTR